MVDDGGRWQHGEGEEEEGGGHGKGQWPGRGEKSGVSAERGQEEWQGTGTERGARGAGLLLLCVVRAGAEGEMPQLPPPIPE